MPRAIPSRLLSSAVVIGMALGLSACAGLPESEPECGLYDFDCKDAPDRPDRRASATDAGNASTSPTSTPRSQSRVESLEMKLEVLEDRLYRLEHRLRQLERTP